MIDFDIEDEIRIIRQTERLVMEEAKHLAKLRLIRASSLDISEDLLLSRKGVIAAYSMLTPKHREELERKGLRFVDLRNEYIEQMKKGKRNG